MSRTCVALSPATPRADVAAASATAARQCRLRTTAGPSRPGLSNSDDRSVQFDDFTRRRRGQGCHFGHDVSAASVVRLQTPWANSSVRDNKPCADDRVRVGEEGRDGA